jgi:hypothetical protein
LIFIVTSSSLLFFSVIEVFPALLDQVNLDKIRYYAHKRRNIADDELGYRPREENFTINRVFNGDLFGFDPVLADLVEPLELEYIATYEDGFRKNSSSYPYDMLVLGDSFIDIGENDNATFSEKLADYSDLATFNLGRAGYGPYQYKMLLNEYLKLRPKYAVVCFFAGNDMRDVRNYDNFLSGEDYGMYLRKRNFIERYAVAVSDTLVALNKLFSITIIPNARIFASNTKSLIVGDNEDRKESKKIRDYLGTIRLNNKNVAMRFSYWNPRLPAMELAKEKEWLSLESVLNDIKNTADQHDIELIVLYIPSKIQIYGQYYVASESGSGFLDRIDDQLKYERNTLDAFSAITQKLGLKYIDLHSYFRELAKQGELLFYPFDTHWNVNGRKMAAKYVASGLDSDSPP